MDSLAFLVVWLTQGRKIRRAYRQAQLENTEIILEDQLAAHIRKLGWPARAYCESADILHIPIAFNAGLGELGKHGSLINRELGANLRLTTVLTDLPLEQTRQRSVLI